MKKFLATMLCLILVAGMMACQAPAAEEADAEETTAQESATEENATEATSEEVTIKPPVQDLIETVDVIGTIEAETAANDYPQYDWTIGVHSYDPAYANSAIIANAIREECAKYGIEVIESYCNMDVTKYPTNYENFFLQEVDLILDVGWLGNSSVIDLAEEAGVPVVAYDVPFDTTRSWTIGGDPGVAGTTIGTYMAEVVKEQWDGEIDCMCIAWSQALGEPMRIRMQSAIDAIREAGIEISDDNIFWYDGNGDSLLSKNIMTDFLTAHPEDTKILVGANTGNAAQGMLAAVETVGRTDDVMIYSYGAEQPAIDNFHLEPNCWVADVGYYFRQYGWLGVNTAIRVLNGEEVGYWVSPENFVITHDNVDSYQG